MIGDESDKPCWASRFSASTRGSTCRRRRRARGRRGHGRTGDLAEGVGGLEAASHADDLTALHDRRAGSTDRRGLAARTEAPCCPTSTTSRASTTATATAPATSCRPRSRACSRATASPAASAASSRRLGPRGEEAARREAAAIVEDVANSLRSNFVTGENRSDLVGMAMRSRRRQGHRAGRGRRPASLTPPSWAVAVAADLAMVERCATDCGRSPWRSRWSSCSPRRRGRTAIRSSSR